MTVHEHNDLDQPQPHNAVDRLEHMNEWHGWARDLTPPTAEDHLEAHRVTFTAPTTPGPELGITITTYEYAVRTNGIIPAPHYWAHGEQLAELLRPGQELLRRTVGEWEVIDHG